MCSDRDAAGSQRRVSPFGNPRIDACTRLPEAYRSVPRPSSAFGAKASTVSPYYLAHVMQRNRTSSLSFYRKFALYSVGKVLSRRSQPPPGAPHTPSGAPGEGSLTSFSQQDPAHRRAFFSSLDAPVKILIREFLQPISRNRFLSRNSFE